MYIRRDTLQIEQGYYEVWRKEFHIAKADIYIVGSYRYSNFTSSYYAIVTVTIIEESGGGSGTIIATDSFTFSDGAEQWLWNLYNDKEK